MSLNTLFPQIAVGAVIIRDGKVLLVKRAHNPAKGMWANPGGKILPGEKKEAALKREIMEETGLEIEIGELATVFDIVEKVKDQITFHYVIIDYVCTVVGGTLKAGDDAEAAKWFSPQDISTYNIHPKTVDLLKEKFNF